MLKITDTYNLNDIYNFQLSFQTPYFFYVDFEDWKKSFENDIDGEGRALFKNLTVKVLDKIILKDFNLIINDGEIHTIMGLNGSGKSTICKVLMGDSNYIVVNGSIYYNGYNLLELDTTERAKLGLFLVSQNPIEIQ